MEPLLGRMDGDGVMKVWIAAKDGGEEGNESILCPLARNACKARRF